MLQKSSNMKNLLLDFLVIILVISDRVFSPVKVVQCPLTKDAGSVVLKWLYLNLYECAERPAGGRVYRCTVVSRGHLAVDSGFFCGKRASIVSATGGERTWPIYLSQTSGWRMKSNGTLARKKKKFYQYFLKMESWSFLSILCSILSSLHWFSLWQRKATLNHFDR